MVQTNSYRVSVSHEGLHKYRVITARTRLELEEKVQAQKAQWDEQWQRKLQSEEKVAERERKARAAEASVQQAAERTSAAESMQDRLNTILVSSLESAELSFEDLKDSTPFSVPKPQRARVAAMPVEPQRSDQKYNPDPPLLTRFSKKRREEFEELHNSAFAADHGAWVLECQKIESHNATLEKQYQDALAEWQLKKVEYERNQEKNNQEFDELRQEFLAGKEEAVSLFYKLVVEAIKLPFFFSNSVETQYQPVEKLLVIDTFLPSKEDLPSLKKVTFIKSRNEFKEASYPESYMKRLYESVIYQFVLRIIKAVFKVSEPYEIVQSVVVNGRVSTTDTATGQHIEPCILSVSEKRESFDALNLESIDPKAWFKKSKGVSAASLATVTPVAPIIQLDREDHRFIEGYSVEGDLSEETNLAAMDWQDFENLIRELFEEEFCVPGGEVKITQASRDGGVDAVIFDPDPIRGGKIVVQAKRYTNTVGVSAVRDLYGTVVNEGAMKGILVTTSNYGNDAYEFAQGKPITLMNGANLLFLLEKHGHKAKIDLQEAKELLSQNKL